VLGAGEYESAADRPVLQNFGEDRRFRRPIDTDDALLDPVDGGGHWRYGNLGRIAQHLIRERGDGARHRCGKQQRSPLRRKLRDDFPRNARRRPTTTTIGGGGLLSFPRRDHSRYAHAM
jgi:hypothetical protein